MDKLQQDPSIPRPRNTYPSWADVIVWLSAFFVSAGLGALSVGGLVKSGVLSDGIGVFLSYLLQFGLLVALGLWHRSRRTPGRKWRMRFSFHWSHLTQIFFGVILIMAIGLLIEPLLNLMPEETFERLNELMGRGGWMILTAIAVAPILEEVFFRGIVQDALAVRFGPLAAILIASAIFGGVHIIPQQVLNAFFVGWVLGYVYYLTGSLLPVILIHGINNAVAYFTWIIGGEQLRTTRQLINDDTVYPVLYGIAAVVAVVSFTCMIRRLLQAGKMPLAEPNAKNLSVSDTNPADKPVDNK